MNNDENFQDQLRTEYDFEKLKSLGRGNYAPRYERGVNVVRLDPDVYAAFPTSEAVNEALRGLLHSQSDQPDA